MKSLSHFGCLDVAACCPSLTFHIGRCLCTAALALCVSVLTGTTHAAAPQSLFAASRTGNDSGPEGNHYELGTIFRSDLAGSITHVRVYALASETGDHVARLWRNSDGAIIAGPFTWRYGGAAGWITLDVPDVLIEAGTDYTVSVSTGGGGRNYPIRSDDLAAAGSNGLNLFHPAGAGVFTTTPGARPTQTFQNANYYRDIVFISGPVEPPVDGPVRMTEFMAVNESGLVDEDGQHSDWIELYNPSGVPRELGGYQIIAGTDTWTFPAVSLGPQTYLIVFASGKNRTNPGAPLHTSFQLDSAGEYLALRDAGNNVLSEFAPAFPPQRPDYSAGRDTNGSVVYFFTPTPGGANSLSFSGFVENVVFSVKRGFFVTPQEVALTTDTPGAAIRYTLDGSTPTETNGAPYATPISISATATLRARAFKPGFLPSRTRTDTYVFLSNVLQQTVASAQAYGWPAGPVNGQEFRHGIKPNFASLYATQQMLVALRQIPSISIVTDQRHLTDPATGLYVNPSGTGAAWERPVSLELIHPDGSDGFQEDCGLRIRGGQSASTGFPKHSFHVFFRREYGGGKLRFPLFGATGADEFDTIDLRCEHGYAYADPYPYSDEFTAIRDVFCRDLWAATGYASTRSRPYHLYLNGQYWGLYQTQERAQEDYGATYFGGGPEEYDVIKATGLPQTTIEVSSGDSTNWMRLWNGARAVATSPTDANYFALLGRNADGTRNPALPVLLDPVELAAYMLLHYYTGHADEPLSISFNWERPNNFRVIRRRTLADPFHFFVHDGESSMLAPEWSNNRANAVNLTSPNRANFTYSNPEWIHEDLMAHPEYRTMFWDEAHRLLFNDGPFTPARAQAFWDTLAAQIDQAVIGESIRWGSDFTKARQSVWAAKIAQVRTNFFPTRTTTVITQLRQRNQYPATTAPTFNSYGGLVPAGFNVYLTNSVPGGTLYYALAGTDPRARGGGINPAALAYAPGRPITINAQTTIKARIRSGTDWSAAVTAVFYTTQDFTKLLVSEIMYNPPDIGATTGDNLEFLELKNTGANALDLSGVTFTEGITFTFTNGTLLAPGQFIVLGRNAAALTNKYPGLVVHGLYSGRLNNGGEQLTLAHALGGRILSFDYKNSGRWPITPDGWGFSLVPRQTNANPDPGGPSHWRASTNPGGSPGADDPSAAILPVLINEALTHTELPDVDAIELFNPNSVDADVSGWFLTDDPAQPKKFRIPDGTIIGAGGYRVFTETNFNPNPLMDTNSFALSSSGEQVYLFSANAGGNLTGYSHGFIFGGAASGVSFGRHVVSTGDEHFVAQIAPTLNASNAGPRVGPVVIKQIMYHPVDLPGAADNTADEFIEIVNITGHAVPLFDSAAPTNTWHVRGGVSFDFPADAILPPGGALVLVNFNPSDAAVLAGFRGKFGQFNSTPAFGPYSGKLDNSRDTVELNRPDMPETNGVPRIVVDEVTYRDSAPWPVTADGGGGSLQRISLATYSDDPINWSSIAPLTITLQPVSVAVRPGSNAVFTVAALGDGALTYQWRLNGTNLPNGGTFSGVNSPTLTVTNIDAHHRGDYTALVTDAHDAASSAAATLTVLIPPTIVVNPQSATVVQGDFVTLGVLITNAAALPATYEWRVGSTQLRTNVVNAVTNSFTFRAVGTNTVMTNNYRVVVKNAANPSPGLISAVAAIIVLPDADGDHIPDFWMIQHFGHTNALAADLSLATDDADGDNMTNLAEYLAGTDPRDRTSYLRVDINWNLDVATLQFMALSNRSYSLQFRESLTSGLWTKLQDVPSVSTNRVVIVTDLPPHAEQRFYRLATP